VEAPQPPRLTRRRLLAAGGAGLLLAGAGGLVATRGPSAKKVERLDLYRVFKLQQPVAEKVRLPLALRASDGTLDLHDPPSEIVVRLRDPAGGTSAPMTIARRATGIPRGYYPVTVELSVEGEWAFEVVAAGQSMSVRVDARQPSTLPVVTGVGDPLPRIPTPTVASGLGVDPICTREPACPFHTVSLDAALALGRPVVLLVSTPAFCQTAICGPVLDLVVDRQARLQQAGATVVHAEVYTDKTAQFTTSTVGALGLTYEPSLFLAGADGIVTARLDYTFDATELDESLTALAG
jgi:hypothetical protein